MKKKKVYIFKNESPWTYVQGIFFSFIRDYSFHSRLKSRDTMLENKTILEYILLFLIVFLGFYLRVRGVLTDSFAYTYDVGRDLLAVQGIVQNHKIPLIGPTTGVEGIFYGPWWYYILVIPFIAVKGNPQGASFFMALVSLSTVLLSYIAGKKISGSFLGLIFASFVSFFPPLINSQIWSPYLAFPFLAWFFILLADIYKNERIRYFFLLGLCVGFIGEAEVVFGAIFLIASLLSLILTLRKSLKIRFLLSFFLGFLLIILPRIIFELRHNFLMTRAFLHTVQGGFVGNHSSNFLFKLLDRVNFIREDWSYAVANRNELWSIIVFIFVALTSPLIYKKSSKIERQFIQTIFIISFTYLFSFYFFNHELYLHYIQGLPLVFVLLLSFSVALLHNVSKKLAFLIFLIVVWVNLSPVNLILNINKPIWEGDASVYRNQLAVVDYVYNDSKGKPFKYVVYTPPIHDYTYRYLFSWYAEQRRVNLIDQRSKLMYFIIEPDSMPIRRVKWLEQREKDGKIIKEKVVKGGITVQTRIY